MSMIKSWTKRLEEVCQCRYVSHSNSFSRRFINITAAADMLRFPSSASPPSRLVARPTRRLSLVVLPSLLLLLLSAAACWTPARAQGDLVDDIDDLVESIRAAYSIPGLGLAVVKDSRLLMTKGYGRTRLDDAGHNVTEDTLFYIASTTKAITSALIAQILANSSRYTLDTPVREIMPDFHLSELYRQELLSVRDLLSHGTGVTDIIYNWMLGGDVNTRQDSVDRARFFSPAYPLRTRTYYNNLMYTAAGLLLERLDPPLTWEQAMTAHIFAPLGMTASGFMNELSPAQEALLVTPYEADWLDGFKLREVERSFFAKVQIGAPAGSVVSSARDWAKWLLLLANAGRNEAGVEVIDRTVLGETFEPWSIDGPQRGSAPFDATNEAYGLGWYPGFYRGQRHLEHAGYMFGYHSLASFFPDLGLALLSCANGQLGDGLQDLHDQISDLLLFSSAKADTAVSMGGAQAGKHTARHRNPDHDLLKPLVVSAGPEAEAMGKRFVQLKKRASAKNGAKRPMPDEDYIGTYGNFALGNMTVVMSLQTRRLEIQYGDITRIDLFPTGDPDVFLGKFADPIFFAPLTELYFTRSSPGGEVVSLTVPELLPQAPPVLQRGLRMSDAPAPLEPPVCAPLEAPRGRSQ